MSASATASKKPSPGRGPLVALALVAALAASCATLPSVPDGFSAQAWASAERPLVIKLEPSAVRESAELAKAWPAGAGLLDRTAAVWIGLPDPALGAEASLAGARVALEGDFPPLPTAWGLAFSPPPRPWRAWQPRSGVVLVAAAEPDTGQGEYAGPPTRGAVEVRFDHPVASLAGPALARLLDARRLTLSLLPAGDTLEGDLRLEMADARAATAGLVVLRLAGGLLDARLDQDLTWTVQGSVLTGTPFRVPQDGLVAWLQARLGPKESP